jgi:hypothetical protein
MTRIIGISGKKQSGKNTVANYINGSVLKNRRMVVDFYIDEEGQLVINTSDIDGISGYGIFDVTRKDSIFTEYAEKELWPYIKVYHFADYLKKITIDLFDLELKDLYGNDKQKNKLTHIKWEDMPENTENKTGFMTNREFMEHFGTKIVRKINKSAWLNATIKQIKVECPAMALIPDIRFPNEVDGVHDAGGIIVRLTRNVFNDQTEPEIALDADKYDWSNFDHIIDNKDTSLEEMCNSLNKINLIWS